MPVFKKGATTNVANYQPTSLTCVSNKIMERVTVICLMENFCKNNIITKAQHGFLKHLSTCTNLLESFNDGTLSLQNRNGVTVAYVDFTKAFDTVPHEKLLYRLHSYGVDECLLSRLRNFLINRTLCTHVGSCVSAELELLSGLSKAAALDLHCLLLI